MFRIALAASTAVEEIMKTYSYLFSTSLTPNSTAFQRAGALDDLKWKVKWAADHVIAAHPSEYVFAAFLGNSTFDFDYFGPPEYYEMYNPARSVGYVTKNNPGTEVS